MDPFSFGALALAWVAATSAIVLSLKRSPASPANGAAPESQAHRFLCPKCLHFGLFRHACGGCGSPIDPLVMSARGRLANSCSVCRRPLFPRGRRRSPAQLATCRHCGEVCDPSVHHERGVHLVGMLCAQDFQEFRKQAGPRWTFCAHHAVFDAGKALVYALDLTACDTEPAAVDPQHARANLNALWFGSSLAEPLLLGETLDQFLRRTSDGSERERLRVLAGPEDSASAGANVLGARFPQAEYGVAPAQLVRTLRGAGVSGADSDPITLAVLSEEDLTRLIAATDLTGEPILNRHGRGRSPRHGAIRVVRVENDETRELSPGQGAVADAVAVWIGNNPFEVDELESDIQSLFRATGLPHSRAEDLLACLEDPHPHPAVLALLQSRFGRVECGVPPQEFLARGPEARGWILSGRAPVNTLAVLTGTDLWVLGEAMVPRHRHDLGGGWTCEATPTRVNYILNLDAPDRTPGSFFGTPDACEIEAVWVHLAAREALTLAEYLDRMDRIPGLSAERRAGIALCVSHSQVDPAVRNVLEARFPRVCYGVAAEAMLLGRVRPGLEEPGTPRPGGAGPGSARIE